MGTQEHWERIYGTKATTEMSWFRPHLETSLSLVQRVAGDRSASLIDVGGGESTLVDDLIGRGYRNVTVMDISRTALEHTKARLGSASRDITWLVADITRAVLPAHSYDVWHDRAVFHFLKDPGQRLAYVRQVASAVKQGGHVIVGTFGLEGPDKCSGLEVIVTTPTHCTRSLAPASAWSRAPRNCTARRSELPSNFFTAIASRIKVP
jgi:2-polyprenyl-3-methyl-5-hydroxy-6-metoxy-1,4-benzoquinol methylase